MSTASAIPMPMKLQIAINRATPHSVRVPLSCLGLVSFRRLRNQPLTTPQTHDQCNITCSNIQLANTASTAN